MNIKKYIYLLIGICLLSQLSFAQQWNFVGSPAFTPTAQIGAMVIAPDGTQYVSTQNSGSSVSVWKFNGTTWISLGSPSSGSATYSDLAVGPDNLPYIAYRDGITNKVSVRKYNGSSWSNIGIANFSPDACQTVRVAVSSTGVPYVAYIIVQSANVNHKKVSAMRFNGTAWEFAGAQGFSSALTSITDLSLAFDSNDNLHCAYRIEDGSQFTLNGKICVKRFYGSAWGIIGSTGLPFESANPYLAFDNNNVPYIAYSNAASNYKQTVAKYNGSQWVNVGGNGFSTSSTEYGSLDFDSANTPIVGFRDLGVLGKGSVMKFDGTSWNYLGTQGMTPGGAIGTFLKVHPITNIPYFGYCDLSSSNKMSVVKFECATANSFTASSSSICEGQSATLSFTPASGAGNQWQLFDNAALTGPPVATTTTTSFTVSPTDTISYYLLNTNASCTQTSVYTLTINVKPIPVVTASSNAVNNAVCQGMPIILTGGGAASYTWNNGVANGVAFVPSSGNTYQVTGTAGGCQNTAQITVTVNALPTVTATSDAPGNVLCAGETVLLSAQGAVTYVWNPGAIAGDNLSVMAQTNTIYTVTGTDSNGCSNSASLQIVQQATSSSQTHSTCSAFTLNGQTYTTSGTYIQIIPNAAGCDSTITLNLTISDLIAPVANTPALSNVTSQCSVTSLTAPTAMDNCAGIITGTHNAPLPITMQGTTVVTWTYNDGHGNTSTQTQNVIITDNTAPVANLTSLSNITSQCSVTSLTAPTATDNCAGTITGMHNATLPITTQGTTVVTWTYNDGHGNTSTQTQNVIIADNTAPVANLASLANVTSQCSVTSLTAPTATDNCAGTITGTHNASLPITTQGTTIVTWTYSDGHGNSSTQTQNIIITDNIAPIANLANLPAVNGNCSVVALTAPTATDNCAGTITGTHNTTLPITTPGTTVVTWTYNDGHGNMATQTQNVIITVPVATTTLSGLTITATTSGATYQWINCGNGNTPISGATSQSFTATTNGTYAVIVTQNGCSATSACVTISTVGLDEIDQTVFAVYPNPNNGTFKVIMESSLTIQITNATGQLISTQQLEIGENTVELSNAESGMYFISATDLNGRISVQRVNIIE